MASFRSLACEAADDLLFGRAPKPVQCKNGMVIGGGLVYPEINFTLPPMEIAAETMPAVIEEYREMVTGVCARARELEVPGMVVELELLPPMTVNPAWGIEVTKVVREVMFEFEAKHGLPSVLRVTPNDTRESERPPRMHSGKYWDNMLLTFEGCAEAGADFLAIESTGGKELCDEAILMGDIAAIVFALGVLGVYDMRRLWGSIVSIAARHDCRASGDSACGFANTAMVLADQGYIPKVFAAAVRLATIPRSLAAYEMGAIGPSKDCAYEGPYMKAIAGVPISMEGKSSACAHLSSLGNIAGAVCDLWSNESVQNIKLLSAMAPVVSMEQLIYDVRLMNKAGEAGGKSARDFRDLLVESDSAYDPQAYVLRPDFVHAVSEAVIRADDPYRQTVAAVGKGLSLLKDASAAGRLRLNSREMAHLDGLLDRVASLPDTPAALWREIAASVDTTKFLPQEYGWPA